MSAAVMSATPALPTPRKVSVWGKLFSSKNKKDIREPFQGTVLEQAMNASSSALDRSAIKAHKRGVSSATKASAAAPSIRSMKSTTGSFSSNYSRRSTRKWFSSSNPADDELPPVPTIDTKFLNSTSDSVSPTTRKIYVPRNAASSFIKTTTPGRQSTQDSLNEVSRQLSVASSMASLKPIAIKNVELRKDSHALPEEHGMFSMAGACEIAKQVDEPVEELDAVDPVQERVDSPVRQMMGRADSANGTPELAATKHTGQRDPSFVELSV